MEVLIRSRISFPMTSGEACRSHDVVGLASAVLRIVIEWFITGIIVQNSPRRAELTSSVRPTRRLQRVRLRPGPQYSGFASIFAFPTVLLLRHASMRSNMEVYS